MHDNTTTTTVIKARKISMCNLGYRKTIRDIGTRLQNCESENTILKSDNASLVQQIKKLNTIKANLEEQLSRYQHSDINFD
jgi:hypothetical protein